MHTTHTCEFNELTVQFVKQVFTFFCLLVKLLRLIRCHLVLAWGGRNRAHFITLSFMSNHTNLFGGFFSLVTSGESSSCLPKSCCAGIMLRNRALQAWRVQRICVIVLEYIIYHLLFYVCKQGVCCFDHWCPLSKCFRWAFCTDAQVCLLFCFSWVCSSSL